jgi:hypothetical protein
MISRVDLGVPNPMPFAYDTPPEDDSSDARVSSGEDSREDEPIPIRGVPRVRPRTRKQMSLNVMNQKTIDHLDRQIDNLNDKTARGIQMGMARAGQPVASHWDVNRKDFLLLEYCQYGDLENLLYR